MITEETKTHRRCIQIQCGHYKQGGCKPCDTCKAEPFVIKKTCRRCLNCEGVPGELRWDDPKAKKEAANIIQFNKEMEKEVKKLIKEQLAGGGGQVIIVGPGGFGSNIPDDDEIA